MKKRKVIPLFFPLFRIKTEYLTKREKDFRFHKSYLTLKLLYNHLHYLIQQEYVNTKSKKKLYLQHFITSKASKQREQIATEGTIYE